MKALTASVSYLYTDRGMAVLTIRDLPDGVRDRLRVRAARSGRSMEAEVRAILTQASLEDEARVSAEALQRWVDDLYGEDRPGNAVEDLLKERRNEAARE